MKNLNQILCLLLVITTFIFANEKKFTNMNPDKNGEPWYLDYYQLDENPDFLSTMAIENILKNQTDTLPSKIDHSFSKHMRPVFNQIGGSCGSASRICYMFGYELNNHRNLEAKDNRTTYPSHFTWLLTGQNSSKDEMAIFNGVPNALYYNGDTYSTKYGGSEIGWPDMEEAPDYGWMNGYNRWENALNNRLQKAVHITLNTPENLEVLKSWMLNHHGDEDFQTGGVAGAGVASGGMVTMQIPSGLYESGKHIVKNWGPQVDHGTTWSGYDDEVGYDFNEDGQITNDIDITGDGKVDMADWEKGALIMLNSWSSSWKNQGTVYVPYRLLKMNNMSAEFYYIRKNYTPKKIMKIKMDYNKRSDLKLSIGISSDTSATLPEKVVACHHFINAGNGKVPMLGKWKDGVIHDEPMEFCFDLTDLTENLDISNPYHFYFKAAANRFTSGEGTIYSVSVVDYAKDSDGNVEYFADIENLPIIGGDIHYIPILMSGETGELPEFVYIPQSSIQFHSVTSEETSGEDGAAINVLDGDPSTIWHTDWFDTVMTYPHELQLELDENYDVAVFEYLPRQNSENGRIAQYEIYLSDNDSIWGDAVATGTWPNSSEKQTVSFIPTTGKFVKLVAVSEVNGNDWASCSEINILYKSQASTSISEELSIPSEFRLNQNYPNPFNPTTNISFHLQMMNKVKIEIYNLVGQKVETLTDREFSTGNHSLIWDASNYSSGIYFCKMATNDQTQIKKMLLQK